MNFTRRLQRSNGVVQSQLNCILIEPMGKNERVLLVLLGADGEPKSFSVLSKEVAGTLMRIRADRRFFVSGFILPKPWLCFQKTSPDKIKERIKALQSAHPQWLGYIASFKSSLPVQRPRISRGFAVLQR